MEFERKEPQHLKRILSPVENIDPIEEEESIENESNKRPLKEFADRQNLKMPTLPQDYLSLDRTRDHL